MQRAAEEAGQAAAAHAEAMKTVANDLVETRRKLSSAESILARSM